MCTPATFNSVNIAGSWFPSGYHGHFRSRSRNDVDSLYRNLAKPQPPRVFITRLKEPISTNVFSHHDNRYSFNTDATYLDRGVGRKGRHANAAKYTAPKQDLLHWHKYLSSQDHIFSSYRDNYNAGGSIMKNQLNSKPPGTLPSDSKYENEHEITAYRYDYGKYNANKPIFQKLERETLLARPKSEMMIRSNSNQATSLNKNMKLPGRLTVADCMVWRPFKSNGFSSDFHQKTYDNVPVQHHHHKALERTAMVQQDDSNTGAATSSCVEQIDESQHISRERATPFHLCPEAS